MSLSMSLSPLSVFLWFVASLQKAALTIKPKPDLHATGGADSTDLDVGEGHRGVGRVGLHVRRLSRGCGARAAADPGVGRGVHVGGVVRVEPEHLGVVVVPEAHHEHQATVERVAHALHRAIVVEPVVGLVEVRARRRAELVGDGVGDEQPVVRGDADFRSLDLEPVLDVEALDLLQVAAVGAVGGHELGHHGDGLGGVHREGGARAEEVLNPVAVRVQVAPVLVAHPLVPAVGVVRVDIPALRALALRLPHHGARVRGVRRRDRVRLPDVELRAARPEAPGARVGVRVGGFPLLVVGGAVDELDVVRALRVAVARAELGPRVVPLVLRLPPVLGHLHKVQRAVEAARELRVVHRERELTVFQVEHLVLVFGVHQVVARADVGEFVLRAEPLAKLLHVVRHRHEVDVEGAALSGDAVRLLVRGAFEAARGRARHGARLGLGASRVVPLVAREAVHAFVLEPPPIRVHRDRFRLVSAASSVAVADSERGGGLLDDGASHLG
mmetsp:Transcript_4910/g.8341  ORF Transcript_4910/g.8341 Transcript_4910/m.8341 type:complete len:500 (+) Transcript_4910:1504-3003(+)